MAIPDPIPSRALLTSLGAVLGTPLASFFEMFESRLAVMASGAQATDASFAAAGEHAPRLFHQGCTYAALACYTVAGAFLFMRTGTDAFRAYPVEKRDPPANAPALIAPALIAPAFVPPLASPAVPTRQTTRMPYMPWSHLGCPAFMRRAT